MSFHVRRKDREITKADEMHQVSKQATYVTVALCMEGEPYLVSLSHGDDQTQNCLYFHCALKVKNSSTEKPTPKFGDKPCWILGLLKNAIMRSQFGSI